MPDEMAGRVYRESSLGRLLQRARTLGRLPSRRAEWIRAADALIGIGGVPGPALLSVPPEPGECCRQAVPAGRRLGAHLIAVCARIHVTAGGATARLLTPDGAILDHLYCPTREEPYDLALFARAGAAAVLRVGHVTPESTATILASRLVSFNDEVLEPRHLVPQRNVTDTANWPRDPYGEPGTEDAAGRLRHLVFATLTDPVVVNWLHDLRIALVPGDEQSRCLMKSGLYEPEGLAVVGSLLRPGGNFVDVGANCGIYTLFAARAVGSRGQVIAFEPSGREFARLERNVELNAFRHVRLHNEAVSDQAGPVSLRIAEPGFAGHNTIADHFAYAAVGTDSIVEVKAVTLDGALAGLTHLAMIKLDIEGAELKALKGAEATLARLRPALLLEIYEDALGGSGTSPAELADWLEAHDYSLHDIDAETGAIAATANLCPGVNRNFLAQPKEARAR